jgi:hypothetical protein
MILGTRAFVHFIDNYNNIPRPSLDRILQMSGLWITGLAKEYVQVPKFEF